MTMRTIDLSTLRLDFQPPENLDEEAVSEYAQQIADGLPIEPIVVRFDGESYFLQDGFHRVEAARKCGLSEIDAEITPGSLADMEAEFREDLERAKASLRDDAQSD